jgi:hypothetical protein
LIGLAHPCSIVKSSGIPWSRAISRIADPQIRKGSGLCSELDGTDKKQRPDPTLTLYGDEVLDKKKGKVRLTFEKISDTETRIVTESMFHAVTGAVFARGFVDHVWLNFFENMMLASGMISDEEFLTNQ